MTHRDAAPARLILLVWCAVPACAGCWSPGDAEVVVYTALDREFSEPIFEHFHRETGIKVLPKYDTESTKTVGLTNLIFAEGTPPRCDVFWNNEILNTLRLQKAGLLEVYTPAAATHFPRAYRAADGSWHGLAARARVLIVNTRQVPEEQRPRSIRDLVDPKWKGRVGIAKPLFGTTATHAACLFAYWGDEKAKAFFRQLKQNAKIMSGNKQVALAVGRGELAFGLTDTDDAVIERDNAMPVAIIFPDQEEGGIGTLLIPNTVAIVKGSRNARQARVLVDYLLSAEVEEELAKGRSAQFPLSSKVKQRPRVEPDRPIKTMEIDFAAAADKWETAARFLEQEFTPAN